jgi:hypothetical protein
VSLAANLKRLVLCSAAAKPALATAMLNRPARKILAKLQGFPMAEMRFGAKPLATGMRPFTNPLPGLLRRAR